MKYLPLIICISIFVILVCLYNGDGYIEGMIQYNHNRVEAQLALVEAIAATTVAALKNKHIYNISLDSNIKDIERILLVNNYVKELPTNESSIMADSNPIPNSDIIATFKQITTPFFDACNDTIKEINSYGLGDPNMKSILNEDVLSNAEKLLQIEYYVKFNKPPPDAPISAPIAAPIVTANPSIATSAATV